MHRQLNNNENEIVDVDFRMMMSDEGKTENYKINLPVNDDAVIERLFFTDGDEINKSVQSFGK